MSTSRKYSIGDVVRLKSGGPQMTVTFLCQGIIYRNRPCVTCQWFDEKDHLQEGVFDEKALTQ